MKKLFLYILLLFPFTIIAQNKLPEINLEHLNHLYQDVNLNGYSMAVIHIYADYPDYKWVNDEDEGMACLDDVSRAAIVYMKHYRLFNDSDSYNKAKNLIKFVLYMQAANGYFYNFVWPDLSINKTFKTSTATPNWWSWRALWCLSEAQDFFKKDKVFALKIKQKNNLLIKNIIAKYKNINKNYISYEGYLIPDWLPYGSAADQSALIVLGLSKYYEINKEEKVLPSIEKLADGILKMQQGNMDTIPYYAFLSWQNTFHAYGNSQAYSLLYAGQLLKKNSFIKSSLNELNYFHPYILKENQLSSFSLKKNPNTVEIQKVQFSQIAYGISPFILSNTLAYKITGKKEYLENALKFSSWFTGNNPTQQAMYDEKTGVCFDGINSKDSINKNSGAESTIECLLSLLSIYEVK